MRERKSPARRRRHQNAAPSPLVRRGRIRAIRLEQQAWFHERNSFLAQALGRGFATCEAKGRGRRSMKRFWSALGLVIFCAALAHGAADATISGVVKDPAGAPFRGAFVRAQNVQSKISVNVMSDNQGRYRISNLPPGEYQIRVTATGYQADPRSGVKLAAGASSS